MYRKLVAKWESPDGWFCRKGGNQHGHRVLESGGTLGAFFFSQDRNVKCGGLCMKREMHAEKTYWKNH